MTLEERPSTFTRHCDAEGNTLSVTVDYWPDRQRFEGNLIVKMRDYPADYPVKCWGDMGTVHIEVSNGGATYRLTPLGDGIWMGERVEGWWGKRPAEAAT